MLTKSRMRKHNYCFYNFKEEELFINSSKTKGVYPNIIEKIVEQLDIKTYDIKFPAKVIFTPQTYLWLDEFVDCPYYVDKKHIKVTMEKMALQLMLFAGDITKYGLARAMSKMDEQKD